LTCCPYVVFIDLDGTIWDHEDISQTTPPYTCNGDVLVDSKGTVVKLHSGVRSFIALLKNAGLKIFTLSWNDPAKALRALECLGLKNLFDGHAISNHPHKHLEMLKVLRALEVPVKPCQVIYIDDRDIHVSEIVKSVGDVWFIHMWRHVHSFNELTHAIMERFSLCRELDLRD